jgi:AcrR family transcriptional regulator
MSATRDRILDAFEALLIAQGPRAATLDAVAAAAEVSKGGLLYHFPSKAALAEGQRARLAELGAADVAAMRAAPEGASEFYLRGSMESGGALDRALVAAVRLSEDSGQATAVLDELRDAWYAALLAELADPALAHVVQLVGDGMYYNAVTGIDDSTALDDARAVLARLRGTDGRGTDGGAAG